jgi:hypothetical protein
VTTPPIAPCSFFSSSSATRGTGWSGTGWSDDTGGGEWCSTRTLQHPGGRGLIRLILQLGKLGEQVSVLQVRIAEALQLRGREGHLAPPSKPVSREQQTRPDTCERIELPLLPPGSATTPRRGARKWPELPLPRTVMTVSECRRRRSAAMTRAAKPAG